MEINIQTIMLAVQIARIAIDTIRLLAKVASGRDKGGGFYAALA